MTTLLRPSFGPALLGLAIALGCLFTTPAQSAGRHAAWLQGDKLTTGRDSLGSTRPTPIAWLTRSSIDTSTFEHNLNEPGDLIVKRDGDYFVAVTLPIIASSGERLTQRIEVYVNSRATPGSLGQSTYIRNASGHTESSGHVHVLLPNLAAGDVIEVRTRRIAGTSGTSTIQTASLYAEWIAPERTAFAAGATETASGRNLNVEEATEDTSLLWTATRSGDGFGHTDGDSEIRLNSPGAYLVYANVPLNGAIPRSSVALEILLDGTRIDGGLAQQGYIRNSSSHQDSSLHWAGLIRTTRANQSLRFATFQRALEGTVTMPPRKEASVFIERLTSEDGVYQGAAFDTGDGDNWNLEERTPLSWDAGDAIIDTAVYDHSTGSNAQSLEVKQPGNYLVLYNDTLTGGATRANPRITLEVNGIPQDGAETKTHYIRNADGHTNTSATLVYYLEGLQANDILTISTQREGGGGAPIAEEPAQWVVIRKETLEPGADSSAPPRVAQLKTGVTGFSATIEELGIAVDLDSFSATVEERPVTLSINRGEQGVAIEFEFETIPNPRSRHDVVLRYQDMASPPQSYELPFSIIITTPFRILPFEFARVEPDTSQPGFDANITQISTFQSGVVSLHGNTIAGAERQLAGEFEDADGNPYLNEAGSLNATAWEPGLAVIETVINLEQDALDAGNFTFDTGNEDDFVPLIPGWNDSLDGIVGEFTTYLDLPAGFHTLGVNSDDGFEVVAGDPDTPDTRPIPLGEFDGGRGSADTLFNVAVQTPGVYWFRLLWFEAGGGANVEFFSVHEGEKILINDPNHPDAFKAYRAASGRPEPPAEPGAIQSIAQVGADIVIEFTGDLKAATSPEGPYTSVGAQESPYRTSPNQATQFYIAE